MTQSLNLARQPLFAGLSEEHLRPLLNCVKPVTFAPGSVLLRESGEANLFYVLTNGQVVLELRSPNKTVSIQTLHAGDVLGLSWLVAPYRWQFDATAQTAVEALAFESTCFRQACEVDTVLGYELMKRFAKVTLERLQATRLQLLDMYGKPL